MAHPNEELLRSRYEAQLEGDIDTVMATMADDVTLHIPGDNPLSGVYEGKEAVLGAFGKTMQMADSFDLEVDDILANDERGVVFVTVEVKRGDETHKEQGVHLFRFAEGKIVEQRLNPYEERSWNEFWS